MTAGGYNGRGDAHDDPYASAPAAYPPHARPAADDQPAGRHSYPPAAGGHAATGGSWDRPAPEGFPGEEPATWTNGHRGRGHARPTYHGEPSYEDQVPGGNGHYGQGYGQGYGSQGHPDQGYRGQAYHSQGYERGYEPTPYQGRAYEARGYEAQAYEPPAAEAPGYEVPGYEVQGYRAHGYEAQGYAGRGYENPGYEGPAYGTPGYENPGYERPAYGDPAPSGTGYNGASYAAPPIPRDPGHDRPAYPPAPAIETYAAAGRGSEAPPAGAGGASDVARHRPAGPAGGAPAGRGRARESAAPAADEPAADEPAAGRAEKRRRLPLWQELPLLLIIAFCLAVLIRTFLLQAFFIPSGSMEDTLIAGDRVLVNKVVYQFREPTRGEVVVFKGTDAWAPLGADDEDVGMFARVGRTFGDLVGVSRPGEKDFIKRVIGIPGDVVSCCDVEGRVFVNGEPIDETYVIRDSPLTDAPDGVQDCRGRRFDEVVVEPGNLFVMGDHRQRSQDSRCQGQVPIENVIGRAFIIVWPNDRWAGLSATDAFANVPAPATAAGGPHLTGEGAGAALPAQLGVVLPLLLPLSSVPASDLIRRGWNPDRGPARSRRPRRGRPNRLSA